MRRTAFSVPSWNIMPGTTYLGHNIISRIDGKFRPESWKEASAQRRNSRGRLAKRETPFLVCVSFGVDTMALNPRPPCKYKSRRMISHGWGKRSRPLHVGGFVTPWARRILPTEPGLYQERIRSTFEPTHLSRTTRTNSASRLPSSVHGISCLTNTED